MGLLVIRQDESGAAGTYKKISGGVLHYCSRCGSKGIILEDKIQPNGTVLDFHHDGCSVPPFRQGIRLEGFAQEN